MYTLLFAVQTQLFALLASADLDTILTFVNKGGTIALLVVIVIGGFRQWFVFGWQYREAINEKNSWRELALRGTDLADKLTQTVKRNLFVRRPEDDD